MRKFLSITFLIMIILQQALHGSSPCKTTQESSPSKKPRIDISQTTSPKLAPGSSTRCHTEESKATADAIAILATLTTLDNMQVPESIAKNIELVRSYAVVNLLGLLPQYKGRTYFSDQAQAARLADAKLREKSTSENKFDTELADIISRETSRIDAIEAQKKELVAKKSAMRNCTDSDNIIADINKKIASIEKIIRNQIVISTQTIRTAILETNKRIEQCTATSSPRTPCPRLTYTPSTSSQSSPQQQQELDRFADNFIALWNQDADDTSA